MNEETPAPSPSAPPPRAKPRKGISCMAAFGILMSLSTCSKWIQRQVESRRREFVEERVKAGQELRKAGDFEGALREFDAAIKKDRYSAWAHNNRGLALRDLDRTDEAIRAFKRATVINSDYVFPYYNRGRLYIDLRRYEEAVLALNEAVRLKPENAYYHYYRARALAKLSRKDEAVAAYEEVIRIAPSSDKAQNSRLAIIHLLLGKYLPKK
ncbi:MAG: tetratricopeptide repeat protein [Planctomycetota bacterium]